jgi:hypothetical protein
MTEDPIDQLAWECGFLDHDFEKLAKFAQLVRARAFLEGFDAGMHYQQVINERDAK